MNRRMMGVVLFGFAVHADILVWVSPLVPYSFNMSNMCTGEMYLGQPLVCSSPSSSIRSIIYGHPVLTPPLTAGSFTLVGFGEEMVSGDPGDLFSGAFAFVNGTLPTPNQEKVWTWCTSSGFPFSSPCGGFGPTYQGVVGVLGAKNSSWLYSHVEPCANSARVLCYMTLPSKNPTTTAPSASPTTFSPTTPAPSLSPTKTPTTHTPTASPSTSSPSTAPPSTGSPTTPTSFPTTPVPTSAPSAAPTTSSVAPTTSAPSSSPAAVSEASFSQGWPPLVLLVAVAGCSLLLF